jgi:transcriptional regulator with XRE-family HTH domain
MDRIYPDLKSWHADHKHGLTALAEKVGCSVAALSRIKKGDRVPGLPLALRLAAEARIPLESLLKPKKAA